MWYRQAVTGLCAQIVIIFYIFFLTGSYWYEVEAEVVFKWRHFGKYTGVFIDKSGKKYKGNGKMLSSFSARDIHDIRDSGLPHSRGNQALLHVRLHKLIEIEMKVDARVSRTFQFVDICALFASSASASRFWPGLDGCSFIPLRFFPVHAESTISQLLRFGQSEALSACALSRLYSHQL